MMPTNGDVKPIARIEILLLSNGQLAMQQQVPSRYVFNGMMETAKQEGLAQLFKAEQSKIVVPEPVLGNLRS